MQTIQGHVRKMHIEPGTEAIYSLVLDNQTHIPLNPLLGHQLECTFSGKISCVYCKRSIKKSFNQGYCFVCFKKLARCDQCIIKPEQCHYHLGTCREPEWGDAVCMQKHIVYLAYTSGVKVGITRKKNTPTRWLDQGANLALPLYEVNTRLQSGLLEQTLKQYIADKTHWRTMLSQDEHTFDLKAFWDSTYPSVAKCLQTLIDDNPHFQHATPKPIAQHSSVLNFHYPRIAPLGKIQSINVDKTPHFPGTLIGMKGQYLLFDCGVINLRKYTGYHISITVS